MFQNVLIGDTGTIHIVLTNFCNQGCVGCYQENLDDTKNNFILNDNNKKVITKIFTRFESMNQQIKIAFFGGEPLTRIYTIIDIIKYLIESNMIPDYINIPTSGGKNQNLIYGEPFKLLQEYLSNPSLVNTKITISQSYDGPNNNRLRNAPSKEIKESIQFVTSFTDKDQKPEYTSCLIPLEPLPRNYFVTTFMDVYEVTGRLPSFRIPHIIEFQTKDHHNIFMESLSNALKYYFKTILVTNFIEENSVEYQRRRLITMAHNGDLPKLFGDLINQIVKPKDYRFLWCQAGTNHLAITNNGLHPNGCEYLNEPATDLWKRMQMECINCEIQAWCHKPCLKSMETRDTIKSSSSNFTNQCTVRKIIFNEIKNILLLGCSA